MPVYTAPWEVAGYVGSLEGSWTKGQVKLEVSWDDGANYHEVRPDETILVSDSATPGVRQARITLYNYKSSKPILTELVELFDQDGSDVETRNVLRFNAITGGVRGLYVARDGTITLESTIVPSTPDKALLMKITPTGSSSAPTLLVYTNKRRAHLRYRGTMGITAPNVVNDLAVEPTYVRAYGVVTSGKHLYDLDDPATVAFDTPFTILGVTTGDDYVLEVEG